MMESLCSPILTENTTFPQTRFTSQPNHTKKNTILVFITKILILLLCYHALQHHRTEKEVEIEEEEPELVVVTNPSQSRKTRKGHA